MNTLTEIGLEVPAQVESSLCSRFRSTKSDCAACAAVCPAPGAVRLGDGIGNNGAVINAGCVACGACVSACPNGAIQLLREDDAKIAERIAAKLSPGVSPAGVFRIACTRAQGKADIVLPCLARLTEALVLEPIRRGAPGVELMAPDCSACGLRKGASQWQRTLAFAQALCATAGTVAGVDHVPVPAGSAEEIRLPPREPNARRRMFGTIAERWQASAESHGEETKPADEAPPVFRDIVQQHSENPKRAALLAVLATFPARTEPQPILANNVPLARIEVNSDCVGCNVCIALCPTGALSQHEEGGRYVLELDAAQCTGCGNCEAACYHQAIHLREATDLSVLFLRPRVTLVSAQVAACSSCGERLLGDAAEFCPTCRLSGNRRDDVARRFFSRGA